MTEKATGTIDQAQEIQNQLNQALKNSIKSNSPKQVITNPDGMETVERTIVQAPDKIAALMTAVEIQQAVDSDELREKADELVRNMPENL